MESNENMVQDFANDAVDAVRETGINKTAVVLAAGGVTLLGVGIYALNKYVIKPMWKNHKQKKDGVTIVEGVEPEIQAENVEVDDAEK